MDCHICQAYVTNVDYVLKDGFSWHILKYFLGNVQAVTFIYKLPIPAVLGVFAVTVLFPSVPTKSHNPIFTSSKFLEKQGSPPP